MGVAALRGAAVDRPPVSFWGHVYHRESSAAELVEHTLERQREYHWDWVKLNPRKHYHVEDWGVRYRYSGRLNEKPVLEEWPIQQPEDWGRVTERAQLLKTMRSILLAGHIPATVEVSVAVDDDGVPAAGDHRRMVPELRTLRAAMESHPEQVRRALEAVTTTYGATYRGCSKPAPNGSLRHHRLGSRNLLSAGSIGAGAALRPADSDRDVGRAVQRSTCKSNALLFEMADYPVSAFSYDATDASNPSLAEALARVPGAVMGGISYEDALQDPSPSDSATSSRAGWSRRQDAGG